MSDETTESKPQHREHDMPPKAPIPEAVMWTLFGTGAVVWCIAAFILLDIGYGDDPSGAIAWMGVGQWLAGIAFVPAALLTGIRYLMPAARAYFS